MNHSLGLKRIQLADVLNHASFQKQSSPELPVVIQAESSIVDEVTPEKVRFRWN